MKIFDNCFKTDHKVSYSQCGEDLIVDFLFKYNLKIQKPSYLDIGAHHPTNLSNTYLFYRNGSCGVCVEPDPNLWVEIQRKRKRDICLNAGVGITSQTSADLFVMTAKTLNTFSREEAERYASYGQQRIEQVIQIPMININEIIQKYFKEHPNFVSLDVEGLDLDILKTLDFEKHRPEVFCIETLTYTENNTEVKIDEIINYMLSKGYKMYADTYINTIFVEKETWANR